MKVLRFTKDCVRSFLLFLRTMASIIFMRFFRTKVEHVDANCINIILNGPSSSEIMPLLGSDMRFTANPSMVVNFFANCKEYEILKPMYYCFADPMFYRDVPDKTEKVKSFFETFKRKTTWNITVFLTRSEGINKFKLYSGVDGENFHFVEVNTTGYYGFDCFRNMFYKIGLCAPLPYTVAIMAIYTSINMGFENIHIYGLDNNYYKSLCLDKANNVCDKIEHNGEPIEIRTIKNEDGSRISLHDYLLGLTYHLKNHEYTNQYAKSRGIRVINHSKFTMVDAYEREF